MGRREDLDDEQDIVCAFEGSSLKPPERPPIPPTPQQMEENNRTFRQQRAAAAALSGSASASGDDDEEEESFDDISSTQPGAFNVEGNLPPSDGTVLYSLNNEQQPQPQQQQQTLPGFESTLIVAETVEETRNTLVVAETVDETKNTSSSGEGAAGGLLYWKKATVFFLASIFLGIIVLIMVVVILVLKPTTTTTTTTTAPSPLPTISPTMLSTTNPNPPRICTSGSVGVMWGDPWVVCTSKTSMAWVSSNNSGQYNALQVCQYLGYNSVVDFTGVTCDNVCGSCGDSSTSCINPGSMVFLSKGSGGSDTSLCCTVQWLCG